MSLHRILVAAEDIGWLEGAAARLQALGHEVITATNEEQLVSSSMKEQPDIIMFDFYTASDVCQKDASGRKIGFTCNVPIVFMQVRAPECDYYQAFKQGMARYLRTFPEDTRIIEDGQYSENMENLKRG